MAIPSTKRRKIQEHHVGLEERPTEQARNSQRKRAERHSDHASSSLNPVSKSTSLAQIEECSPRSASFLESENRNLSLIDFQVSELINRVQPKYDRMCKLDSALRKLTRIIHAIPDREPMSLSDAKHVQSTTHKVNIPFPEVHFNKDIRYKLSYAQPASIEVTGCYARRTSINLHEKILVDLAIGMPSRLFEDKDFMNYRYFHKRAYYLACIATAVRENSNCHFTLEYADQDDNALQPVIVVNPSIDNGEDDFRSTKARIRIVLHASQDLFSLKKTLPTRNCIKNIDSCNDDKTFTIPTPFYNATLRSECSSVAHDRAIKIASENASAFKAASILGAVWLSQRGFDSSISSGGFGSFQWDCIMALLLLGGDHKGSPVLSTKYTAYQMFKATLRYLATTSLVDSPKAIMSNDPHHAGFQVPTFFDGVRCVNVLFKMTLWSYHALRHSAIKTNEILADPLVDHVDACFRQRVNFPIYAYDCAIRMPCKNIACDQGRLSLVDCQGGIPLGELYTVLQEGLGDRVTRIDIRSPPSETRQIGTLSRQMLEGGKVLIGFDVNAKTANRLIDKGPSAEDISASQGFRNFWGEKAELRRFRDGSILESLVWSSDEGDGSILSQIIRYLLNKHLARNIAESIEFADDVVLGSIFRLDILNSTDCLAPYRPLITAFEALQKDIRALEGLPLRIRQVSPADAHLRYSSQKAPKASASFFRGRLMNLCVRFEGSNRWPDDLNAIQRSKIAFLLKMAERLQDQTNGLNAYLGLEHLSRPWQNVPFLDIHYPTGAAFRLRLDVEHEKYLIEKELSMTAKSTTAREAAASALSAYKRSFIQTPLHTQAVSTLCTRFALLSPCIRILKAWRDSHLLSAHISDELIELLTIRTFVHPGPYSLPGSIRTGFSRTLLFISKWDWRRQPLIVDLNGNLNKDEVEAINTRFEAWRSIDPAMSKMVLFAASSLDLDGITWTESGPSKVAALRFTSLARAATSLMEGKGFDLEVEGLFAPDLSGYDFVFYLNREITNTANAGEPEMNGFKNLQIDQQAGVRPAGFDPADLFLKELRELHSKNVVLFWNADGGSVIGGLWNPITTSTSWRINIDFSSTPTLEANNENAKVNINRMGTLNDIARLGGDMIERLKVRN
ncbi:uncharacterized protein KY384_005892 [Bacidia gigantensis]|uniref:uncharacterized protein n=1 Tax=Bacidia gigantensis TaxID=2732470 RepID=UPI001D0516B1|nr:uncharacterized protein KY384_005892 [Bacidia gigantensis]KAG8529257.1 hypothetical protein KY384_005892 [Bacidia gigantensis]